MMYFTSTAGTPHKRYVVAPDGATVATCPDAATAADLADRLNLVETLREPVQREDDTAVWFAVECFFNDSEVSR